MSTELPAKMLGQIRRYQPIETDGVTLYPITVDEYDLFNVARPAIEFVQQSLPVAYISQPLLQSFFAIDVSSVQDEQLPSGMFPKAVLFLALAMRIGVGETAEQRVRHFQIYTSPKDVTRLAHLRVILDGEEFYDITPVKFQRWIPIFAAQNGITLHDDTENPELLRTEAFLQSKNAPELELNLESLVSGVAALSGTDEAEMYDWPILKLNNRQTALKRVMDYIICGVGEANGTTWKKGNPVPHPYFAKSDNSSAAVIPLGEFAGGAAQDAVNQATT